MENSCPSCGAPLGKKAEFCPHCGLSLHGAPSAQTRPMSSVVGKKRIGTASWADLKGLILFYALLMGVSLVMGLAGQLTGSTPYLDLVFSAIWIGITLIFLEREWGRVRRVFFFRKPRPKILFQLALLCAAAFFFLQGYFWAFGRLGVPIVEMSSPYVKAGWPLWAIFGTLSVEPGFIEEIAFRGILLTRLSQILSRKEALLIQAALFSVLHLSPEIFISHFVMGLLLGWVRLRSGHVYYGMLLHMAWNAFVVAQELVK